ncbi:MAG: flavin reductase family protein, partial [Phycisphaerales bacterium]
MQKQTEFSQTSKNKYPQPVVIVIAKDKNGKFNPVTIGCVMIASIKPPMMAIAIATKHHSTEAIRHSKCFTIAYPTAEMADATLFFGSRSGRDVDKFAEFDCKTEPAKEI